MNEAIGHFLAHAAIHQFLFDAAQFGKFRQDRPAAKRCQDIRRVADGRIGGDAGKTVGAATFQADAQMRKWCRRTVRILIHFHEPGERLADRFRHHPKLRSALLLLEHQERFRKLRITFLDLLEQNRDLRMLAAKAQNGGTGNVRVMNVTGNQGAKIIGILPCPAATAFVRQKLDSVHVLEDARTRRRR